MRTVQSLPEAESLDEDALLYALRPNGVGGYEDVKVKRKHLGSGEDAAEAVAAAAAAQATANTALAAAQGAVSGPASSSNNSLPLWSTDKTLKNTTLTGILKLTAGVADVATPGADLLTPDGVEIASNKTLIAPAVSDQVASGAFEQHGYGRTIWTDILTGTVINPHVPTYRAITADVSLTFSPALNNGEDGELLLNNTSGADHAVTVNGAGGGFYSNSLGQLVSSGTFTIKAGDVRRIGITKDPIRSVPTFYGEQDKPAPNDYNTAVQVASAAGTVDISSNSSLNVAMTGTQQVTGFTAAPAGTTRYLYMVDGPKFAPGTDFIVQGGYTLNLDASATATALALDNAGKWLLSDVARADGEPVNGFITEQQIAAAATVSLATLPGKHVRVTGSYSGNITSFGAPADGKTYILRFVTSGSPTIVHDLTKIVLPGGHNWVIEAGDQALVRYLTNLGAWLVIPQPISGQAMEGFVGAQTIASAATCDLSTVRGHSAYVTGTTGITSFGTPTRDLFRIVQFQGALTITHGSALQLPGSANYTTAADESLFAYYSTALSKWYVFGVQPRKTRPDGFVYRGALASIPAASGYVVGDRSMIDSGLTVNGITLQPFVLQVTQLSDGTKVWKPPFKQTLISRAALHASPLGSGTAAGTSPNATCVLLSDAGTLPAGLLTVSGLRFWVDALVLRGTVTATADATCKVGGSVVARANSMANNANATGRISGGLWVIDSSNQISTGMLPAGGVGNAASSLALTLSGSSAQTVSFEIASATVNDTFTLDSYAFGIE